MSKMSIEEQISFAFWKGVLTGIIYVTLLTLLILRG